MPEIPVPSQPDPTWHQRWNKRAAPLLTEVRERYGVPAGEPVLSSERSHARMIANPIRPDAAMK